MCDLSRLSPGALQDFLGRTDVGEVWGVGRRIAAQLKAQGVETGLDLSRMSPSMARSGWSVIFERTVRELQGEACMDLETQPPAKKEIACTRSFGAPVRDIVELQEAVSHFSARASSKLREQDSLAGQVLVFNRTSPFRKTPQYSRSIVVPLRRPTSDIALVTGAALRGLGAIFRPGFDYAKAGVMLLDITPAAVGQQELALEDEPGAPSAGRHKLMAALDQLNARYGRDTLRLGSACADVQPRNWVMKQERRTPAYTTRWEDMPMVRT